MKHAMHLLEDADLSISEIAGRVGYVNTSHFAAAFRKEYGLNPSHFRFGV
jgi:AraC-like DNA-binding protein